MCEYANKNICRLSQDVCPFMYFCTKINGWRPNPNMPVNCRVKLSYQVPPGKYLVRMVRGKYLYVDTGKETYKVENPFTDNVPAYVELIKGKEGYKIKT